MEQLETLRSLLLLSSRETYPLYSLFTTHCMLRAALIFMVGNKVHAYVHSHTRLSETKGPEAPERGGDPGGRTTQWERLSEARGPAPAGRPQGSPSRSSRPAPEPRGAATGGAASQPCAPAPPPSRGAGKPGANRRSPAAHAQKRAGSVRLWKLRRCTGGVSGSRIPGRDLGPRLPRGTPAPAARARSLACPACPLGERVPRPGALRVFPLRCSRRPGPAGAQPRRRARARAGGGGRPGRRRRAGAWPRAGYGMPPPPPGCARCPRPVLVPGSVSGGWPGAGLAPQPPLRG